MDTLLSLKNTCDDFEVEFDVIPAVNMSKFVDERQHKIIDGLQSIEAQMELNQSRIDEINADIDRLTNHADGLDYAIAVSSGIITGMIDVSIVGEWDFAKEKAISNEEMNNKVMDYAKEKGYKGDRISVAIEYLEKKYPLPGDNTWSGKDVGINTQSHHLDDFGHHPTIVGLIFSIITQFTGTAMYSNSEGEFIKIPMAIDENGKLEGKTPIAKVSAGIINWCFDVARNRKGHLMSDMVGSKSTAGAGMGLPGSIMSTLKELSALPGFRDTEFPKKLAKAYKKGIGTGRGQLDLGAFNSLFEGASSKMDLRTENAFKNELRRKALPVLINEILVRNFYFVRHLINELKEKEDLDLVDWKSVLPFRNRTIVRMLTIATGTFTAVDMADAAIESVVKADSVGSAFLSNMVLRVNFVGIGRFAVAIGTDVGMGVKCSRLRNERIVMCNEQINLINAKIFYKQANMWIAAESAGQTIEEAYEMLEKTTSLFIDSMQEMGENLKKISGYVPDIEKKNSGLLSDIDDILIWG